MAISSLAFYQDNKVGDSNLMPIHSPLVFLVDAVYSGLDPYFIYCKVYEGAELLGTFKCIPYKDITTTQRRFMFIADSVLRGYMEPYEDFNQSENTLVYVEDITKEFKLVFSDPDANASDIEIDIVALHGASQFGETPNKSTIYNNDTEIILAAKAKPCYIYFYNEDESNDIEIGFALRNVKFIISDSLGFVNEALVQINGQSSSTNTNGEAEFQVESETTYSYTITKSGYTTKTGSVFVGSNDVILNITLEEVTQTEFTLEVWGENAAISIRTSTDLAETPIYTATSPVSNQVTVLLYPGTYYVSVVHPLCGSYGATYNEEITVTELTTLIKTSEPPASSLGQRTVTFSVTDGTNPIENAEVTKNGTDFYGNCFTNEMLTDVNGEVSQIIQNRASFDFKFDPKLSGVFSIPHQYTVTKSGYTTVTGSETVSTNKTINIVLNTV